MTNGYVNAANSDQGDNNPGELFHFLALVSCRTTHSTIIWKR